MAFVHRPYELRSSEMVIPKCISNALCFERVPSIRQWWQTYLTGLCEHSFAHGHNPHAVDAACNELLRHVVLVFGGYGGSLPSEMVQNLVMRQQPILYEMVVGRLFHRRWHAFILQYTDTLTLVSMKSVGSNPEWCWRLCQTKHRHHWEMVDAARTVAHRHFEDRILAAMVGLLSGCRNRSCNVQAVIWHITPLIMHEEEYRPLRVVRLLRMVDGHSDLFTTTVECNGAVTIHLAVL
jgi:hypothetical protein